MVNFEGELVSNDTYFLNHENRGLKYGDALFETVRVVNGTLFFWEDHYFRLMASMRILRMEIPMEFTLEFLQEEILKTIRANALIEKPSRVRITIFRKNGGRYTPKTNDISFTIDAALIDAPFYTLQEKEYEVALFKDFYMNADMLSNLKTANKIINVVAGVFAKENGYDNCLLLNTSKQVVESINGNIFIVNGNAIKTPPLADGCLDGILRKKLSQIMKNEDTYEFREESISPFELQKADELFITNVISGIIPVTKYRKRQYTVTVAQKMIGKLNAIARLA